LSPRKSSTPIEASITDYRHAARRKNIPPAGLAAQGKVQEAPKTRYFYDPHLPPVLRFDETGASDRLPELLATARQRPLTEEEAQLLAEALKNRQPWLEWSGKREKAWFDVDPVALHIHERVSAQAIIKMAARQPLQRSFFADPELEYRQAVQFYQHDVDWAGRLILGDSLVVMHSLARREDLAGKVQMIYIDPPYGIKFSSNFQPEVGKRDVKDKESDLTREPEQVKAYRDTWTLGVHSYLAYLRDRFIIARELLADSGSIFVQIGNENVHNVRSILDEIFNKDNYIGEIIFTKTTALGQELLDSVNDYILWYCKDKTHIKYRQLFLEKVAGDPGASRYTDVDLESGELFTDTDMRSQSGGNTISFSYEYENQLFSPAPLFWKTNLNGMERLANSGRLLSQGNTLRYKRFLNDFPVNPLTNIWSDVGGIQSRSDPKIYVVQTTNKVIERCMIMTTDPGDLVLDPTCGSGTTAYVAEQWGRRWITIDTSRVAIALARQRLLTARYDYYELANPQAGPAGSFIYKTVPHITLKSIAQNQALDPVFAKWEPVLAEKLRALNAALAQVAPELRARLQAKLAAKERQQGKKAVTDADRRRWLLPKEKWEEWEVPFDTDPDWTPELQAALLEYRKAWRGKMDEVNAVIAASAPQETLVDQPRVVPGVLRVSGPFTVEGVQPVEETLEVETPIGGEPEELQTFGEGMEAEPQNAAAYLDKMIRLLRQDGVRFPDNKVLHFDRLEPLSHSVLHAEGEWGQGDEARRVAVSFGPQYGPITAQQVEECLREAYRRGYDDLIFAGFTIDGAAQAIIQEDPNPKVRSHLAHIRPDVNMGDLLKDTPSSQLFTVFGLPRVNLTQNKSGEWVVEMEGVDIYDPVENTIRSTGADKVAAWFLDSDYDGQTFCITQAFFPDSSAWEKLARALKTTVDPERFEAFSGTRSLPFAPGKHKRVAVKVIDPRGNEVMRVMKLD
jgi:adenine-specific DNA-methyltransferase